MLPIRQSLRTAAISESEIAGKPLQAQRLPALIQSLFQPPPAGLVALLRGPDLVLSLATFAAGLYALKGHRVLLVDAGNNTDPYIVSRLAHAARQDPRPVLARVHVIRTFTVHQLAALTFRRLERFIRDRAPGLVILSGATSLFADANVPFREASWLLREIAAEVNRQAASGCRILVTAADPPVESGRTRLHLPWLDVASRSIRVKQGGAGLIFQHEKPFSRLVEVLPADQLAPFVR
jgi:hypothetical protein